VLSPMSGSPDPAPEKPLVLVVEDEILVRLMISEELRAEGFRVIEAANGEEALIVLKTTEEIALLLTDVRMPGPIDGTNLAGLVRSNWPSVKIIMTSAHMVEGDLVADAFFGKPYDVASVIECTKTLLGYPRDELN
jgi:two-component system, response regulator PdtaR